MEYEKKPSTARNQNRDEINAFFELDKINLANLKESQINNQKVVMCSVVAFFYENILTVHSSNLSMVSVFFMLGIYKNLQFQTLQT